MHLLFVLCCYLVVAGFFTPHGLLGQSFSVMRNRSSMFSFSLPRFFISWVWPFHHCHGHSHLHDFSSVIWAVVYHYSSVSFIAIENQQCKKWKYRQYVMMIRVGPSGWLFIAKSVSVVIFWGTIHVTTNFTRPWLFSERAVSLWERWKMVWWKRKCFGLNPSLVENKGQQWGRGPGSGGRKCVWRPRNEKGSTTYIHRYSVPRWCKIHPNVRTGLNG